MGPSRAGPAPGPLSRQMGCDLFHRDGLARCYSISYLLVGIMLPFVIPIRQRLDRAGIALSALCAVHCVLSVVLVSVIGVGAGWGADAFFDPSIHRFGLLVATLIAAVAIGWGAMKHRMAAPFVVAMMGLTFMGAALAVPHGAQEAVLTIIGVALVSLGHILNLRHLRTSCTHGAEH